MRHAFYKPMNLDADTHQPIGTNPNENREFSADMAGSPQALTERALKFLRRKNPMHSGRICVTGYKRAQGKLYKIGAHFLIGICVRCADTYHNDWIPLRVVGGGLDWIRSGMSDNCVFWKNKPVIRLSIDCCRDFDAVIRAVFESIRTAANRIAHRIEARFYHRNQRREKSRFKGFRYMRPSFRMVH